MQRRSGRPEFLQTRMTAVVSVALTLLGFPMASRTTVSPPRTKVGFHRNRWLVKSLFRVAGALVGFIATFPVCGLAGEVENAALSDELRAPAPDLNDLSIRLQKAIARDPLLTGAWLDVEADDQAPEDAPGFVFRFRTVVEGRADEQLAAIDRIVGELVPAGRYRYDDTTDRRLPYDKLLEALRRLIQSDMRLPGCAVLGMGYRSNPDDASALELVPRFQVARAGQFDALTEECRRIVTASPAWEGVAVFDGDTDFQRTIVPEPPEPDLNELFEKVQYAVQHTPALQGAWLDVEIDDQGYPDIAPKIYQFTRGFDSRRQATQAAAMEQLAAKLIPTGRFRFDIAKDRILPLSELLDTLRYEIDIEPRFAGCSLAGATYRFNKDDASFDLVLHGRVWRPQQADAIAAFCRQLMADSPVWEAADVQLHTADNESFATVSESPVQGAMYYSQAMHPFWKGDYASADHLLSLASIEDPQNVLYRYWRVIGELARGDQSAAEKRLQKTIEGFQVRKNTQTYLDVLRAIYRVQGPLRQQLMAAENKAMIHATRTAGMMRN